MKIDRRLLAPAVERLQDRPQGLSAFSERVAGARRLTGATHACHQTSRFEPFEALRQYLVAEVWNESPELSVTEGAVFQARENDGFPLAAEERERQFHRAAVGFVHFLHRITCKPTHQLVR